VRRLKQNSSIDQASDQATASKQQQPLDNPTVIFLSSSNSVVAHIVMAAVESASWPQV
jgi:hypothetical protein